MAKKKSKHGVLKLGLGLSTAAVATVASAYFIYKKSSPKTKAKMRGWALKMRGEVLEQLEELKEVNEKIYNVVIDEVSKRYIQAQHIDLKDIEEVAGELKSHWKGIARDLSKKVTSRKKMSRRTPKKSTRTRRQTSKTITKAKRS